MSEEEQMRDNLLRRFDYEKQGDVYHFPLMRIGFHSFKAMVREDELLPLAHAAVDEVYEVFDANVEMGGPEPPESGVIDYDRLNDTERLDIVDDDRLDVMEHYYAMDDPLEAMSESVREPMTALLEKVRVIRQADPWTDETRRFLISAIAAAMEDMDTLGGFERNEEFIFRAFICAGGEEISDPNLSNVRNVPGEKAVGVIYPVGYKNQCCLDRPFILYVKGKRSFRCRCECGDWCTPGSGTPIEAITQYEMMCLSWPGDVDLTDKNLISEYFRCYPRRLIHRMIRWKASRSQADPKPDDGHPEKKRPLPPAGR